MLGILWAKGLQPSIAPGVLAAPQGVSVFPFSNKPPSGMETCPAPFQGPGMLGAAGRGGSAGDRLGLKFTSLWCGHWTGWGQSLPLILVPWGSLRGQSHQSGLRTPSPHSCIPAYLLESLQLQARRCITPSPSSPQAPQSPLPQAGLCVPHFCPPLPLWLAPGRSEICKIIPV